MRVLSQQLDSTAVVCRSRYCLCTSYRLSYLHDNWAVRFSAANRGYTHAVSCEIKQVSRYSMVSRAICFKRDTILLCQNQ